MAERTAATHRLLVDFFDGVDAEQLRTPSLCSAWTVGEVLAHWSCP